MRRIFLEQINPFISFLIRPDEPGFKQVNPYTSSNLPQYEEYFDRAEYLRQFHGGDKAFAKVLVKGAPFISFVDTYFEKRVNNMMIYLDVKNSGFKEAYDKKFNEGSDTSMVFQSNSNAAIINSEVAAQETFSSKEWPKNE